MLERKDRGGKDPPPAMSRLQLGTVVLCSRSLEEPKDMRKSGASAHDLYVVREFGQTNRHMARIYDPVTSTKGDVYKEPEHLSRLKTGPGETSESTSHCRKPLPLEAPLLRALRQADRRSRFQRLPCQRTQRASDSRHGHVPQRQALFCPLAEAEVGTTYDGAYWSVHSPTKPTAGRHAPERDTPR